MPPKRKGSGSRGRPPKKAKTENQGDRGSKRRCWGEVNENRNKKGKRGQALKPKWRRCKNLRHSIGDSPVDCGARHERFLNGYDPNESADVFKPGAQTRAEGEESPESGGGQTDDPSSSRADDEMSTESESKNGKNGKNDSSLEGLDGIGDIERINEGRPESSRDSSGSRKSSRRATLSREEKRAEACSYLHRTLNSLKEQDNVASWLESYRSSRTEEVEVESPDDNARQVLRQCLIGEDIFHSIASVAHALNGHQAIHRGFAIIDGDTLFHFMQGDPIVLDPVPNVLYPGRILLLPGVHDSHTFLIIVQINRLEEVLNGKDENSGRVEDAWRVTIHVIDSAPWTLGKEQRTEVYVAVRRMLTKTHWNLSIGNRDTDNELDSDDEIPTEPLPIPSTINWVTGIQEREGGQAAFYTILNGWALLLGLRPNLSFEPSDGFFDDTYELLSIVLGGFASWELIWNFLRCHGFVDVDDVPEKQRKFEATIPMDRMDESFNLLAQYDAEWLADRPLAIDFGNSIKLPYGRPHDQDFPWDDWDREDIHQIPTLQSAGQFDPGLSRHELKRRCRALAMLSTSEFPEKYFPCLYYKELLDDAFDNDDMKMWIHELDSMPYKRMLQAHDTVIAIASVTLAVASIQRPNAGFSILSPDEIQGSELGDDVAIPINPTIRPGSPMIVPFNRNGHIVLLVIRTNEDFQLEILVLDSKFWHLQKDDRKAVYQAAWRMIRDSQWCRLIFSGENPPRKPQNATWIRCAQQPGDWMCGYYAILNAWALALGLELDPDFDPDLTDDEDSNFFTDLRDIIRAARIGRVDWRLLVAFLECYGFVIPDQEVHGSRRFSKTHRFITEQDFVRYLGEVREEDYHFWKELAGTFPDSNEDDNAFILPNVRRRAHNSDFPSDIWYEDIRLQVVPNLVENGMFDHNQDFELSLYEIDQRYTALTNDLGLVTISPLQQFAKKRISDLIKKIGAKYGGKIPESSHKLLVGEFYRYFNNSESTFPGGGLSLHQIDQDPCSFFHFRYACIKIFKPRYENNLGKECTFAAFGNLLSDEEALLGIASIIQAIEALQKTLPATSDPFSGGFAIASPLQASLARSAGPFETNRVMRPRRVWFLPFVIDREFKDEVNNYRVDILGYRLRKRNKGEVGHMFLVVVQEEQFELQDELDASEQTFGELREFRVYILDSDPKYYDDIQPYLYTRIKNMVRDMYWANHRNDSNAVDFNALHWKIQVPKQDGSWQCDLHLILNAWILAMGLTPNENVSFEEDGNLYKELYDMIKYAMHGLLDWKTLVAWFLCRKLTVETSMIAVPDDRRFARSQYQPGIHHLEDQIQRETQAPHGNDFLLGTCPQNTHPYDYGNNVDFANMNRFAYRSSRVIPQIRLQRGKRKASRKDVLYRRLEDVDKFLTSWGRGVGGGIFRVKLEE